tara:strand:+ start:650 stop:1015 length:366 start_codon:yes stop_codon:yes gene_type:complete
MRVTVKVENLKIYAYHGCMKEEEVIGSDYIVNVTAFCSIEPKRLADEISTTVNYVDLAKIVVREMGVRSKMLETVAERISSSCLKEITLLEEVCVSISKICPPINADVEKVTVSLSNKRKK